MTGESSLFEYLIVMAFVAGYTIIALGPVRKITDDVAGLTWTCYYGPIHVSVVFFIVAGFDDLLAWLMAIWILILGVILSWRTGLFKVLPSFPRFSRIASYIAPAYPISALLFYYILGPWGKGDLWLPVTFGLITLIPSTVSGFALRHKYPYRMTRKRK